MCSTFAHHHRHYQPHTCALRGGLFFPLRLLSFSYSPLFFSYMRTNVKFTYRLFLCLFSEHKRISILFDLVDSGLCADGFLLTRSYSTSTAMRSLLWRDPSWRTDQVNEAPSSILAGRFHCLWREREKKDEEARPRHASLRTEEKAADPIRSFATFTDD